MKIRAMRWSNSLHGDRAEDAVSIYTDQLFEVEVPPGKYVARAVESKLFSDLDGSYLCRDDRFTIEGVSYKSYPINQDRHPIPGGPEIGTVVVTEYLIVADVPFTVRKRGMSTDEDYGTCNATIVELDTSEAVQVSEGMELSDQPCTLYHARSRLLNP